MSSFDLVHNILNQIREHAAAVLAGLMKGGDEDLARDFRERACREANLLQGKRRKRLILWPLNI